MIKHTELQFPPLQKQGRVISLINTLKLVIQKHVGLICYLLFLCNQGEETFVYDMTVIYTFLQ